MGFAALSSANNDVTPAFVGAKESTLLIHLGKLMVQVWGPSEEPGLAGADGRKGRTETFTCWLHLTDQISFFFFFILVLFCLSNFSRLSVANDFGFLHLRVLRLGHPLPPTVSVFES